MSSWGTCHGPGELWRLLVQGCKLVPGDNSITAKLLAKWLTQFPQGYLCEIGVQELSNHPNPGSMLLRMEASLAFSLMMACPLLSFCVSLFMCNTYMSKMTSCPSVHLPVSSPHVHTCAQVCVGMCVCVYVSPILHITRSQSWCTLKY